MYVSVTFKNSCDYSIILTLFAPKHKAIPSVSFTTIQKTASRASEVVKQRLHAYRSHRQGGHLTAYIYMPEPPHCLAQSSSRSAFFCLESRASSCRGREQYVAQSGELFSQWDDSTAIGALLTSSKPRRAELTAAFSRARVRERNGVIERSRHFEEFLDSRSSAAQTHGTQNRNRNRDVERVPPLNTPMRVLHFLPPRRHLLPALSLELPRKARRLGVEIHVLVDAATTRPRMDQLQCEYAAVYTCGAKGSCMMSLGALRAKLSGDARPSVGVRFDAVITWSGFHVAHADALASFFSAPTASAPSRSPPSYYLGRHQISEGSKAAVRRLLANTSARVPHMLLSTTGSATMLDQLTELNRSLVRRRDGPCYPCFIKPDSSIGGSAGDNGGLRAIVTDFHALHTHATRIQKQLWLDRTRSVPPRRRHSTTAEAKMGPTSRLSGAGARASSRYSPAADGSLDLIVERLLSGPIVYAEVAVRRGELFRCSFRASTHERERLYRLPASLTGAERRSCEGVVVDVVRALDLRNGVFGFQLVLHKGRGSCAFLEANLRPHGWPLLHELSVQTKLTDLWEYATLALLLALNADDEHLAVAAPLSEPPPMRMEVECTDPLLPMAPRLTHSDSLMLHHRLGLCRVSTFPARVSKHFTSALSSNAGLSTGRGLEVESRTALQL